MSISEIHALLALMDDPDETVYDHVRDRLLSKGKDVLPFVNDAALSGRECALFHSRLTKLQEGLQQSDIREELECKVERGIGSRQCARGHRKSMKTQYIARV